MQICYIAEMDDIDFTNTEAREAYFAAKLAADMAAADALLERRHHLFDEENTIIMAFISARINRRLTQAELAARIGCPQSTISRFESGKSSPSLKLIMEIAKILGLGIYLLAKI